MKLAIVLALSAGCLAGPVARVEDAERTPGAEDRLHEGRSVLPPISGGTLLVTADGAHLVASDPDGDAVFLVPNGATAADAVEVATLEPGDEPGRGAEDAAGRIHVVLRGAGEIATLARDRWGELVRRHVCAEPRGIAYEPASDRLVVACTSGELVWLPAAGGPEVRRDDLGRADLRDVVVVGDELRVSRFRSAEILDVTDAPTEVSHPNVQNFLGPAEPAVAWRMVPGVDGGVVMVLQAEITGELGTGSGAYYGSIIQTNVFTSETGETFPVPGMVAVDVAVSPAGEIAVVSAGDRTVSFVHGGTILGPWDSEPIAAAFDLEERLVVQLRDPARLRFADGAEVVLSEAPRHDVGHETFHLASSGTGLACASCHPEGGDDGHTWHFELVGSRRTQSLRGGLLSTAPFHWSGDLATFHDLMDEVFVNRMLAPPPSPEREDAVASWLDAQPAPTPEPRGDPESIARGESLFYGEATCGSCHAGEQMTNDTTVSVGTGGLFQVPSLVGVFARAPYMHDGCANTLAERFDPYCGGDHHGKSGLSATEVADLVAFLETL